MPVELQFLQTLSTEAQNAYKIAQYLLENPGKTIGQASKWVTGRTWDAARLSDGLAKVTRAMAEVGGRAGDFAKVKEVVAHGTQVAAETGAGAGVVTRVLTSIGRGVLRIVGREAAVSSAAALGTGVVVTVAVLGTATYIGANVIGSRSGDAAVQAGARMQEAASTPVLAEGTIDGGYAVFVLPDNSGGTVWIGDEDYLKTLRTCDTPNGGLCDDPNVTYPPVRYVRQSPDFATYEEALASHCAATVQRPGYWGNKAEGYGGLYWSSYGCP